jgi:hypothetical protein
VAFLFAPNCAYISLPNYRPLKHLTLSWLFLLTALTLSLPVASQSAPVLPRADQGKLDLRSWNFAENGPTTLDGKWQFFWEQFLYPGEITRDKKGEFFDVLSLWNDHYVSATQLKGQGFATYHLTIRIAKTDELLAFELPDMYCSYALWVDGKKIATNGVVGVRRKETRAQWMPQTVVFKPKGTTIDVILQVANFMHYRGGMNDHIYLGLASQMLDKREGAVITNTVLTGGLGLIGCFFVILFMFFRKDRAALYFAALCITWAIRSLFTNLYLFIHTFPNFDWELAAKIEYLTLYMTMMWSVLFVSQLFPHDTYKPANRVLLGLNGIFIVLTLATPALVFTKMLEVYLVLAGVLMAYIAYIVLRALIFGRAGAFFTTISLLLGVGMFSYDMLTFREFFDFNPIIFSVGYMAIFFFNATAIAYQLSLAKPRTKDEELSFDEMKMKDNPQ